MRSTHIYIIKLCAFKYIFKPHKCIFPWLKYLQAFGVITSRFIKKIITFLKKKKNYHYNHYVHLENREKFSQKKSEANCLAIHVYVYYAYAYGLPVPSIYKMNPNREQRCKCPFNFLNTLLWIYGSAVYVYNEFIMV